MTFLCVAGAQEIALWKEKLPGFRKALATDSLPEKIFVTKEVVPDASGGDADAKTKEAVEKLGGLPVTGLVWSNDPVERRVLMGDIVMRQGEAIPSYVFDDGQYYVLVNIARNHLSFSMRDENMANSFDFEVPFGLKNRLKNESRYSTSSKNDKK